MQWFVMLRYLAKTETYKAMLTSFFKAAPFVGRAIVSIIPLFIGYAFLGMALFWESRRFAHFGYSCYTLFAMMHGDMIWATYADMMQVHYVYAQLYITSYLFVSICVIANIFTIIIEEGFMRQKYDSDYSWILDHNKKDKDAIQEMMNDEKDPKKDHDKLDAQALKEIDGVNMDSDVIVSEYRILYLKYEQLIETYKDAIANLSLK